MTNIFSDFRLTILIFWLIVFWQWLYQEIKIKPWFVHNLSLFGSVYNPESIWSFFIFDTIVSIRSENSARGFITIPRETNDFSFDSGQKISYSRKTIIWVDLLTRCLNEIWILSFWIHIWKIFGSLNWFFKLCYLPINCSKFSSCFFFSSWKRSIWLAAYQFSQSNFKFALLFLYIIKFITWNLN